MSINLYCKISFLLFPAVLFPLSVLTQSISNTKCMVNIVQKSDINTNVKFSTKENSHATYTANGSLLIVFTPTSIIEHDSGTILTDTSHIQLTIYSSLERDQDFNISLPDDSCHFINQKGSILFQIDTTAVSETIPSNQQVVQPISIIGEVHIKPQGTTGGGKISAPIIIRIDYY